MNKKNKISLKKLSALAVLILMRDNQLRYCDEIAQNIEINNIDLDKEEEIADLNRKISLYLDENITEEQQKELQEFSEQYDQFLEQFENFYNKLHPVKES